MSVLRRHRNCCGLLLLLLLLLLLPLKLLSQGQQTAPATCLQKWGTLPVPTQYPPFISSLSLPLPPPEFPPKSSYRRPGNAMSFASGLGRSSTAHQTLKPHLHQGNMLQTRRMAIANGTYVSFCNQPKEHYLATSRESRRYVVAFNRFACRHLATSRESKAHFGLPGYAPETIAVNVTCVEREFNACQTHCSMYPSIFNRFAVMQLFNP